MEWAGILVLALLVRIPQVIAARPYVHYVDEGNFLHPVQTLLREGGWDPRWYLYPQLPITIVTAGIRCYAVVSRACGHPVEVSPGPTSTYYEELEPFAFLLVARVLSVVASCAIVVLTGILAGAVFGPSAALPAALLASVTPALVIRSGMATVDPYAALFFLLCLLLADLAIRSRRWPSMLALAGAMGGLTAVCKYPAGVVLLGCATSVAAAEWPWRRRVAGIAAVGLGAAVAATAGMPSLVTHTADVIRTLDWQRQMYERLTSPSLWLQAIRRAERDISFDQPELGLAFVLLAAVGLGLALRSIQTRRRIVGWLVTTVAMIIVFGFRNFQPFRNLLPLVPFGCALIGLTFATIRDRVRAPVWVTIVAGTGLTALYVIPVVRYAGERARLADTRTQAIDWLVRNGKPGDTCVAMTQQRLLPMETRRPATGVVIRDAAEFVHAVDSLRPEYVFASPLGRFDGPPFDPTSSLVDRGYSIRLRLGESALPFADWWWGGNREAITILQHDASRGATADTPAARIPAPR